MCVGGGEGCIERDKEKKRLPKKIEKTCEWKRKRKEIEKKEKNKE